MLYAVGHYFTCEYIMQYICWIKHRCHVFMGIKRFEKIRSEEIRARAGVANISVSGSLSLLIILLSFI